MEDMPFTNTNEPARLIKIVADKPLSGARSLKTLIIEKNGEHFVALQLCRQEDKDKPWTAGTEIHFTPVEAELAADGLDKALETLERSRRTLGQELRRWLTLKNMVIAILLIAVLRHVPEWLEHKQPDSAQALSGPAASDNENRSFEQAQAAASASIIPTSSNDADVGKIRTGHLAGTSTVTVAAALEGFFSSPRWGKTEFMDAKCVMFQGEFVEDGKTRVFQMLFPVYSEYEYYGTEDDIDLNALPVLDTFVNHLFNEAKGKELLKAAYEAAGEELRFTN